MPHEDEEKKGNETEEQKGNTEEANSEQKAGAASEIPSNPIADFVSARAGRYGLEAEDFVKQSDKALEAVAGLIEKGVLAVDDNGGFVEVKKQEASKSTLSSLEQGKGIPYSDNKELQAQLEVNNKQMQKLQSVVTGMMEGEIKKRLQTTHPVLNDGDVDNIMILAGNLKQPIDIIAKQWAERYENVSTSGASTILERHNITMEDLEKKLGTVPQPTSSEVVGDNVLSFGKKEKGLTPMEATRKFLASN